jgi:Ca2+-binding RTX toxin-like protein
VPQAFDVQGISLSTYSAGGYADADVIRLIEQAARNGANHVVFGNVVLADLKTGAIGEVIENGQNQTASLADIGRAIAAAKAEGLDVVLKPQIVVHDPAFDQYNSASWINMVNPDLAIETPAAFFASYKAHILAYARLAQQYGVEVLTIGNEMVAATKPQYTAYWNDIIDAVRGVYQGQLTYAALAPVVESAPTNEITQIGFWRKLDFAGFDVFPSLTTKTNPTVAELKAGWRDMTVFGDQQDYADFLGRMAAHVGKPVVFTETGLPSFDGASDRVATSDGHIGAGVRATDEAEQADWWQAFFETWTASKPAWLKGVWLINNDPGELGAYYAQNYNIDGKLAEAVVTAWYGGETAIAPDAKSVTGGQAGDELYLFGPEAPHATHQAASLTTTVALDVTGAIAGGQAPVLHVWINGKDVGVVALKALDSGYVNGAGVHFTQTQTFAFELPGLVRVDQLRIAFEGPAGATTVFKAVNVNGVALDAATYAPADGGAFAQSVAAGTVSPWNGGAVTFDASPWNAALAARTTGTAADPIVVDGQGGFDTVHLLGSASQYTFQALADGSVRVSEASGLNQNAILKGVEAVQFADGQRMALNTLGTTPSGPVRLTGDAGDNTLMGGAGADIITDPGGRNVLRGGEGDDQIVGGTGFDDTHGNWGQDTITGGLGDDWVVGGQGNDVLDGGDGFDIVYGNLGADTLNGGAGADWVRGGQADDLIDGGAGDDWIWGDKGADTIRGGAGADLFYTHGGAGLDRVVDFSFAEGDRVRVEAGTTYAIVQVGADAVIRMDGGGELVLAGVQAASLPAGWIV